jgi:xanthine dehydrogenase accessory factor
MGTVVAAFESAPRAPGASMLVTPDGTAVGSVSGGCVEGAVFHAAQDVVVSGVPTLQRYGISDQNAVEVGLTCGGTLDVYVERIDQSTFPNLNEVAEDIEAGRPVAVATVVDHPDSAQIGRRALIRPAQALSVTLGSQRIDDAVRDDALGLLAHAKSTTIEYGTDGERRGEGLRVFVSSFAPKPRMIVFGANDFAAAAARLGAFLGYRVTICDARPVFATHSRFPETDEVVVAWPHKYLAAEVDSGRIDSRTAICVLTHDPKFDVPLLELALRLPEIGYVGAMGSRRTDKDRELRLRACGLTDANLSRLASPIGLDLGGRTPEETAVSIVAEIVAHQWGGSGRRLADGSGHIHTKVSPEEECASIPARPVTDAPRAVAAAPD